MKGSITAGILTAAGATLCCTGPALMLLMGSTTVGLFSFLEPIRPYASILALGILGFTYYKVFEKRPDERCCEADKRKAIKKQKMQKRALFGITPVVVALILFPYFGGSLYAGGDENDGAKDDIVSEWTLKGMTCEGCAYGLQGGMAAVKGVVKCRVDYDSKSMICAVDARILKSDAIPSLVDKMGFKAILKESRSSEGKAKPTQGKS